MRDYRDVTKDVVQTGRSFWLAGLGTVAAFEERGRDTFDQLVKKGRKLEKRERAALESALDRAADQVKNLGEELGKMVDTTVHDGMTTAMHRLGVPTRDEIQSLIEDVERLTSKVDELKIQ